MFVELAAQCGSLAHSSDLVAILQLTETRNYPMCGPKETATASRRNCLLHALQSGDCSRRRVKAAAFNSLLLSKPYTCLGEHRTLCNGDRDARRLSLCLGRIAAVCKEPRPNSSSTGKQNQHPIGAGKAGEIADICRFSDEQARKIQSAKFSCCSCSSLTKNHAFYDSMLLLK